MYTNKPSLYIHIPFCASKCSYCDFFSVPEKISGQYIEALISEIKFKLEKYKVQRLSSVYFGGGTPSLLSVSQVEKIFDSFSSCLTSETEVDFELNCDDISMEYLFSLKKIGVNRFSVGIQSLNQKVLTVINRRADRKTTLKAIDILHEFSLQNPEIKISLDFIAGLPYYTKKMLFEDIEFVIKKGFKHISLYSLTLEEKTPLYKSVQSKIIPYDEENASKIWIAARDFLLENGFEQYEVSNFARIGAESLHNLHYWESLDYLGCGSGAVQTVYSADGKTADRISNVCDIKKYCTDWQKYAETERIDTKTAMFEYLMLGFRTKKGVSKKDFEQRFSDCIDGDIGIGGNKGNGGRIAIEDFLPGKVINNPKKYFKDGFYFLDKDEMLFLNDFLVEIIGKM